MNIPKYIEQYRKDLLLKNYSHNTIDNYYSQVSHNNISKIESPLNKIAI